MRRLRMTLADLTVDIVSMGGSIAGKRGNRSGNLLQQGTDLRTVIDVVAGQLGGDDLSSVGAHAEMELSPNAKKVHWTVPFRLDISGRWPTGLTS